eukprot:Transcript_11362.p1 GENE.Transcript_11362~~Transcript_11362.p1  ORF type:complete len:355 (-),score=98.74 Transcript_11362:80-1144(-)
MLRRLSSSRRNSSASLQQQQHAAGGGDAEDSGGHFQRTAEDLRKELLEVQAQVEREQQELMMLRSARLAAEATPIKDREAVAAALEAAGKDMAAYLRSKRESEGTSPAASRINPVSGESAESLAAAALAAANAAVPSSPEEGEELLRRKIRAANAALARDAQSAAASSAAAWGASPQAPSPARPSQPPQPNPKPPPARPRPTPQAAPHAAAAPPAAAAAAAPASAAEDAALKERVAAVVGAWRQRHGPWLRTLLAALDAPELRTILGLDCTAVCTKLPPGSDDAAVRRAYLHAIKRVHPDKLAASTPPQERVAAAAVFDALREAQDNPAEPPELGRRPRRAKRATADADYEYTE